MDSLIAVSTTAAFAYSMYNYLRICMGVSGLGHSLYFESVSVIIALIALGKYLEHRSLARTGDAIAALTSEIERNYGDTQYKLNGSKRERARMRRKGVGIWHAVNFASGKAAVTYDETIISESDIAVAVSKAGYKAVIKAAVVDTAISESILGRNLMRLPKPLI